MNREQFWMKQFEVIRDKYFELVESSRSSEWAAGYMACKREMEDNKVPAEIEIEDLKDEN